MIPSRHATIRRLLLLPLLVSLGHEPQAAAAPTPSQDPPAAPGAMAPRLSQAGESLLLSWLEPGRAEGSHRMRFARLSGDRWITPTSDDPIVEGNDLFVNWADTPSIVEGEDGLLIAHWLQKSAPATFAYDVQLARSTDGGETWNNSGPVHDDGTNTEHGFVTLLRDREGCVGFWLDGRETGGGHGSHDAKDADAHGAMTLRAAHIGAGVTKPALLDPRICDCCGTSAAWTQEGPIVVYRDRSDDEIRDISAIRWDAAKGEWSDPILVHDDGWKIAGCPVNGPAIAANGDHVVVAWFTAAFSPTVRVAFSEDGGRTFGEIITVDRDDGSTSLGRVDVVLTDRGDAIVCWLAQVGSDGEVRLARASADGRVGPHLLVGGTTAMRQSGFPQLESLGEELIVVWTGSAEGKTALKMTRVDAAEVLGIPQ